MPARDQLRGRLRAMEARSEPELPRGKGWQYEPKWDGFRCLARHAGRHFELLGRSGKSLSRYFPDVVANFGRLISGKVAADFILADFILDGELVIPVGPTLSFEALQMRLHPAASRVSRLAAEHPARFVAFDMLKADGEDLTARPLSARRQQLERFFRSIPAASGLALSPRTASRRTAEKWLRSAGSGALDGVVAKRLDQPYLAGERAMVKVKRLRTADCVVGGFRFAGGSRQVGSLLLGLYDDEGLLDHVGFTAALSDEERATATRRLNKLRSGPMSGRGFTGDAPGGPSRWATERSARWEPVKPRLIVEVQYDQVTGERFRHGTRFVRWRPDKAPRECTLQQLQGEARPSRLRAVLAR